MYGTLCRGQRNEYLWPYAPLRIESAFAAGRLYDLGWYPAMTPGNHWVRGELWTLTIEQTAKTLSVLDQLENYRGRDDDLYRRVVIACHADIHQKQTVTAYTYHYVQPLPAAAEIHPLADGICAWPAPQ